MKSAVRRAPKITIVTVVLNDSEGLRLTLESVENQSYSDKEHIVMDGGSSDGTLELLESWKCDYAFKFKSGKDKGIFDAMNLGAEYSSGDLLLFLNAADTFTTNSDLQFVADEWIAGDWEWGYGALRYVTESRKPHSGSLQTPFQPRKISLGLKFVPHQAMYISRSLFQNLGGYDLNYPLDSDQEFAIRASAVHRPAVWVRFLCDFLVGGAHENTTRLKREISYHEMRKKNQILLFNFKPADLAYSLVVSFYRSARDFLGKKVSVR